MARGAVRNNLGAFYGAWLSPSRPSHLGVGHLQKNAAEFESHQPDHLETVIGSV